MMVNQTTAMRTQTLATTKKFASNNTIKKKSKITTNERSRGHAKTRAFLSWQQKQKDEDAERSKSGGDFGNNDNVQNRAISAVVAAAISLTGACEAALASTVRSRSSLLFRELFRFMVHRVFNFFLCDRDGRDTYLIDGDDRESERARM